MGIRALRSHARRQKHLDLTNKITHFFLDKPPTTKMSSTKSLDSATRARKQPIGNTLSY